MRQEYGIVSGPVAAPPREPEPRPVATSPDMPRPVATTGDSSPRTEGAKEWH
jgi:hypothetical protein